MTGPVTCSALSQSCLNRVPPSSPAFYTVCLNYSFSLPCDFHIPNLMVPTFELVFLMTFFWVWEEAVISVFQVDRTAGILGPLPHSRLVMVSLSESTFVIKNSLLQHGCHRVATTVLGYKNISCKKIFKYWCKNGKIKIFLSTTVIIPVLYWNIFPIFTNLLRWITIIFIVCNHNRALCLLYYNWKNWIIWLWKLSWRQYTRIPNLSLSLSSCCLPRVK